MIYLSGTGFIGSCWVIFTWEITESLEECTKSHKTLFDLKNCLKQFTFWLITSVGKNNYCHMVCGLGCRRIKHLLLPIVFFSHLLSIPKKPNMDHGKPEDLSLAKIQAALRVYPRTLLFPRAVQKPSSLSPFKWVDKAWPQGPRQAGVGGRRAWKRVGSVVPAETWPARQLSAPGSGEGAELLRQGGRCWNLRLPGCKMLGQEPHLSRA